MTETVQGRWKWWRRFGPLAVIATVLVGAFVIGVQDYVSFAWLAEQRNMLASLVESQFLWVLLGFGAVYALLVAVAFPAPSVLTIFAGFLFGWPVAIVLVLLSATIGASALFLAARSALGDSVRARFGPRINGLAEGFERDAFNYLLALRLAPVLPFWLVTVAPALFRVDLRVFAAATLLGAAPGTATLSFLGAGLNDVIETAAQEGRTVVLGDFLSTQIVATFIMLGVLAIIPPLVRLYLHRRGQGLPDEK